MFSRGTGGVIRSFILVVLRSMGADRVDRDVWRRHRHRLDLHGETAQLELASSPSRGLRDLSLRLWTRLSSRARGFYRVASSTSRFSYEPVKVVV